MKWLAIVGLVAVVVVLLILLSPAGAPHQPEAPDTREEPDPVVASEDEIVSADPRHPRGPASIEVMVRRDKEPAAARVEIRPLDRSSGLKLPFSTAPPIAAFDVGPDGSHRFTDLPLGNYEVTARAKDGIRARARAFCRPRTPHARASLNLRGGTAGLAGRAVYADGSPFQGFVATYQGMNHLCQEKTGEDGRFVLTGLPAGTLALTFLKPGVLAATFATVEVPKSTEEVFVVDGDLTEFTGRVIADDNEEPVSGACVRASGSSASKGLAPRPFGPAPDRSFTSTATTDAEGGFQFRLPTTTGSFWVEAKGFETAQVGLEVEDGAVIRMKRQGILSGRVVREDNGAPVAGAIVRAWNWHTFTTKLDFAETGKDGRFEGPAGPGKGMIYVLGGGWVSADLPDVTGHGANPLYAEVGQGERVEVEIRVIPSARARGVVLTAEGEPVPGVDVFVNRRGETRAIIGTGLIEVTDEEGRFEFVDLVPGYPYRFRAGRQGEPAALTDPQSAEPGGTIELKILLPEHRWLPVRLIDKETGEPIGGARVTARQASGQQSPGGTTGSDGRVRIGPSAPGDLTLSVFHEDYTSFGAGAPLGRGTPVPDPGPNPDEFVLELTRVYAVSGRIVPVAGFAVGGGMLGVHIRDDEGASRQISGSFPVGEDGSFRIAGISRGTFDLVLKSGYQPGSKLLGRWTVEVPGENLELNLDPAQVADAPSPLTISVFGPDNQPASGSVEIWVEDAPWPRFTFARRGMAISDPVPPGTRLWIQILNAKCADGKPAGGVFHGPVEATGKEIVIHLPHAKTVSGTVVDPDGKPVAGVLIQSQAVPPDELAGRRLGTYYLPGQRTDKTGAFEITGLGNQTYRLRLDVLPEYALFAPLVVEPGTQDLVIRLASGMDCKVRVVDADGKPVSGAEVTVKLEGAVRTGTTAGDGRVMIRGIAADRAYLLSVTAPGIRSDLTSIRIDGWKPDGRDITLPRGMRVEGTVRTEASPAPRAWVWWKDSRGEWERISADVNGGFKIVALAGSSVTLCAAPATKANRADAGPEVAVRAGTTGVSLSTATPR